MMKVTTWVLANMAAVVQKWTFGRRIAWQQRTLPIRVIWATLTKSLHNTDVLGPIAVTTTKESATRVFVTRMVVT